MLLTASKAQKLEDAVDNGQHWEDREIRDRHSDTLFSCVGYPQPVRFGGEEFLFGWEHLLFASTLRVRRRCGVSSNLP